MGRTCNPNTPCDNVTTFKADPDIAGIGVIVSFFVAAWASYLIALYTYLFVDGVIEDGSPIATRLDKNIMKCIKDAEAKFATTRFHAKLRRVWPFNNQGVTKSRMQDVCLMFADLQLATGASILLTGYLRHCEITQYHFYIVSLLGTASFMAFQTLLLIVHGRIQSRLSRVWRAGWVTTIFSCVLLITFVFYNDNFLVSEEWGRSMQCLWASLPGVFQPALMPYVVLGALVNIWAFVTVMRHLFPCLRELRPLVFVSQRYASVTRLPSRLYLAASDTERIASSRHLAKAGQGLTWVLFLFSFTLRELVPSLFVDLLRSFLILFQATNSVKWARDNAAVNGREDTEDDWGFGQILPVLLLALLLLQLVEVLRGKCEKRKFRSLVVTILRLLFSCLLTLAPEDKTDENGGSGQNFSLTTRNHNEIGLPTLAAEIDPIEELENSMYKKRWFIRWILLTMISLYGIIIYVSLTQENGIPM